MFVYPGVQPRHRVLISRRANQNQICIGCINRWDDITFWQLRLVVFRMSQITSIICFFQRPETLTQLLIANAWQNVKDMIHSIHKGVDESSISRQKDCIGTLICKDCLTKQGIFKSTKTMGRAKEFDPQKCCHSLTSARRHFSVNCPPPNMTIRQKPLDREKVPVHCIHWNWKASENTFLNV